METNFFLRVPTGGREPKRWVTYDTQMLVPTYDAAAAAVSLGFAAFVVPSHPQGRVEMC